MKMHDGWTKITSIDMHTGGEPLRIYTGGLPEIPGSSILEKRCYFRDNLDHIRTGTMWEPRGHADMYGAVITEPINEGSDFGTFFLHNEGYSTMCGHAIIALTKYMLEMGLIQKEEENPVLRIDAPPGLITARAFRNGDRVEKVSFRNVPSFLFIRDENVDVDGLGNVNFDVAYGGAFYAICEADAIGLKLDQSHYSNLIDAGRKIKHAVTKKYSIQHPFEEDLSFLYGTIFVDEPRGMGAHSSNVCIFAEGEVDRSPTGTGVSGRLAIHHARGEIDVGDVITIESIIGSSFRCSVTEATMFGQHQAIIPEVEGSAYITGRHEFLIDPDDPLKDGFMMR
jgi:proline racemase